MNMNISHYILIRGFKDIGSALEAFRHSGFGNMDFGMFFSVRDDPDL